MKRFILLLVSFLLFPLASLAIEDRVIVDMEGAMNVALSNNIDLKSAKINIDIAKNNMQVIKVIEKFAGLGATIEKIED